MPQTTITLSYDVSDKLDELTNEFMKKAQYSDEEQSVVVGRYKAVKDQTDENDPMFSCFNCYDINNGENNGEAPDMLVDFKLYTQNFDRREAALKLSRFQAEEALTDEDTQKAIIKAMEADLKSRKDALAKKPVIG